MSKIEPRTSRQNRAYWVFQDMVANKMQDQWINLNVLFQFIEVRPTSVNLHELFKAILWAKYKKTSTTEMTKEEMNECLDDYMHALSMSWIVIDFPDESKKTLLAYYSDKYGL